MRLWQTNHRRLFASSIFLLILCAIATVWMFYRISIGEKWVRHTYKVQVLLGDIRSDISRSGRARQEYLQTGDARFLQEIEDARKEVFDKAKQLKSLVQDNSDEERASEKLEEEVRGRFQTVDESIQLLQSGKSTHEAQDAFIPRLVQWSQQIATITEDMEENESRLLDRRLVLTDSLSLWVVGIFVGTFVLSIYMLWEHYRGLNWELEQRNLAERNAQNLSSQLLRAQDQERRKIARDLHDGLGQTLAAAKMIADSLGKRVPDKRTLEELSTFLNEAVTSTRSISHLLHSPLVDEIGFACAARSYLEGFSSRTGVAVSFDLPDDSERLPADLELTLFRVLQEALSNIQRHSKSTKAEVMFKANSKTATLQVRDYGVGLAPEMIRKIKTNEAQLGVGLAGMKERVRERNGEFEIRSDATGTSIWATFPVAPNPPDPGRGANPSPQN